MATLSGQQNTTKTGTGYDRGNVLKIWLTTIPMRGTTTSIIVVLMSLGLALLAFVVFSSSLVKHTGKTFSKADAQLVAQQMAMNKDNTPVDVAIDRCKNDGYSERVCIQAAKQVYGDNFV